MSAFTDYLVERDLPDVDEIETKDILREFYFSVRKSPKSQKKADQEDENYDPEYKTLHWCVTIFVRLGHKVCLKWQFP